MKYLNYSLTIIMLLCSCKKEKEDFPIILYAREISQVSDVRLFVDKSEVTDKTIIDKFISDVDLFTLPYHIDLSDGIIHFHSKDSATFWTETQRFYVQKEVQQFLFYSDFITGLLVMRPFFMYTSELIPVAPITGYSHMTKEVRVGYGSYTDMEMCFVAYKLKKPVNIPDDVYILQWGTFVNEFNEEGINTLQPLDTLAIMEYKIRFVAK